MSRALVIKGANFEENRVAQVTLSEKSCTGVAFDSTSYTVNSMSTPTVPIITKTPADTTDELTLTVADTSVARVENGGIYAVGFGTTTITATCGSATATATVVVSSIEFVMEKIRGGHVTAATTWGDVNPLQYTSSQYYDCFVAEKTTPRTTPDGISGESTIAVIMIPDGTNKIRIESDTASNWSVMMRYASTDSTLNYGGEYYAKFVDSIQEYASGLYAEFTDIPSGADSFAIDKATINTDYIMRAIFYPAGT